MATGHRSLVSRDHLLRAGQPDPDRGGTSCDRRGQQALRRRLVRELERLGMAVAVEPRAPAAVP